MKNYKNWQNQLTTKIKEQFKNDLEYGEKLYSQNLEDIE